MKKFLIFLLFAAVSALVFVSCENEKNQTYSLAAPTSVTAYLNEDEGVITVSWSEVDGADYYIVYYNVSGSNSYSKSNRLTATQFDLTEYDFKTTYEFKVRAENGNTVSDFSGTVSCTTMTEEEAPAATPVISNIRPGLGWINITIDAPTIECTYEVYENNSPSGYGIEFIKTNDDGSAEYSIYGLDINSTYSSIQVVAIGVISGKPSTPVDLGTITTGNIWKMTKNLSPRHLSFEWDDAAAELNWSFTTIEPLTRTFRVQLAKDSDFNDIVYDVYSVNNSGGGTYTSSNWIGRTSLSSSTFGNCNSNACFGFLEPNTTYYLRVRNAADETVEYDSYSLDLAATNGKSAWSATVSATTEPAHTSVSGELLYQGFDDHGWFFDPLNTCAGIVPLTSSPDYTSEWTGEYGLMAPVAGKRYDEIKATTSQSFPGNGEANLDGSNGMYAFNGSVYPDMSGWYVSKASFPIQGAMVLGNTVSQTNVLVTPAFSDLTVDTNVTISCDVSFAGAVVLPQSLIVKIYRAATYSLEEVGQKEFEASYEENPNGGTSFHNCGNMQNYSLDATLQPGDYVVFEVVSVANVNHQLALDNILVVKK